MCVLTGIDLLACCYAGNNGKGGVRTRFIKFIEDCMPTNCKTHKEQLWSLRNCLLHNFAARNSVSNHKFRLILDESTDTFTPDGIDIFTVNLNRLRLDFELAVQAYRGKLTSGSREETNFNRMFPEIGYMLVYERAPVITSTALTGTAGPFRISVSMLTAGAINVTSTITNMASSTEIPN